METTIFLRMLLSLRATRRLAMLSGGSSPKNNSFDSWMDGWMVTVQIAPGVVCALEASQATPVWKLSGCHPRRMIALISWNATP